MLFRRPPVLQPSEITSPDLYFNRRQFLAAAGGVLGAALAGESLAAPSAFPNLRNFPTPNQIGEI